MFKKFLERILNAKTEHELWEIEKEIDRAFNEEKLSGKDNELLYKTINQLYCYEQRKLAKEARL